MIMPAEEEDGRLGGGGGGGGGPPMGWSRSPVMRGDERASQ